MYLQFIKQLLSSPVVNIKSPYKNFNLVSSKLVFIKNTLVPIHINLMCILKHLGKNCYGLRKTIIIIAYFKIYTVLN